MFNNKSILITGGTGSFGQAFVEHILKNYKPNRLIIFSRDEFKQFKMAEKYSTKEYNCLRYFIGDIRDNKRLKLATKNVNYIVHAAALKQVDIAEYNPQEYIATNIYGAQNVIECAMENNVEKVLALSTDKAANPINLYGATKLAADKLFIAANNLVGDLKTSFSNVRYGNVLNSRGSLIPKFIEISKNKNKDTFFPITDLRMTRFWITLKEAVEFVIYCFQLMNRGEIFVPKIPSVRIKDIINAIDPKIPHKIIGIRPGEKLHEVLCPLDTSHSTLEFEKYFIIRPEIKFFKKEENYLINKFGEKGNIMKNSEYNSENNSHFLSVEEIKSYLLK